MDLRYKKMLFNPNAYLDLKDNKVIFPFSPEWGRLVRWQQDNPKMAKQMVKDCKAQEKAQLIDKKWMAPDIKVMDGISHYTWKYEDGTIQCEQEMKGTLPHGNKINYDEHGVIITDENFRSGFKHGEQKFYYTDGRLQGVESFRNGTKDGDWFTYHHDGSKETYKQYQDDDIIYECRYRQYHKYRPSRKPQVIQEKNYKDGNLHGKFLDCFVTGTKRALGNMKDGEMDGKWKFYKMDGELDMELTFEEGRVV